MALVAHESAQANTACCGQLRSLDNSWINLMNLKFILNSGMQEDQEMQLCLECDH